MNDDTQLSEWAATQMAILRVLDVLAAFFGGLLTLPLLAVVAIAVRVDSKGPAIFRQHRVGRHEKIFVCYKLRTMAENAPTAGTHEVSSTYVTALGRLLRRLKLDELPQLWNVLWGDMSLVGPRPCLPSQVELIEARRKVHAFDIRPGVTGPAQVNGIDMSTPLDLAKGDAIWVRNPNIRDYFALIFMTVAGKGQGDAIRP
ncbi:sugar transferase [Brevundimonas poindexterae]|uniref:sugar transferase n=1 Tax=Brevundimonas poindexterae TaxID=74325 RepID=UPI001CFD4BA8|nr:sugar transferase [Brevundimonas poindexterae]